MSKGLTKEQKEEIQEQVHIEIFKFTLFILVTIVFVLLFWAIVVGIYDFGYSEGIKTACEKSIESLFN